MSRSHLAWISVVAIGGAVTFAPAAFAGSPDRPDSGEPPMGVAFQSDAQGTKLNGVFAMELLALQRPSVTMTIATGGARAVLRLRKGGDGPRGFDAALDGPIDISTPEDIAVLQADLLAAFRNQIMSGAVGFFGEECGFLGTGCPELTITPKRIDESVIVPTTIDESDALYFVSDVELAVK